MPDPLVCDFCAEPNPIWLFPCRDFEYGVHYKGDWHGSRGEWLACERCRVLVDRGERDKLTARSGYLLMAKHPELEGQWELVLDALRDMHDEFWSHREGPSRAATEAELAEWRAEPAEERVWMPGERPEHVPRFVRDRRWGP